MKHLESFNLTSGDIHASFDGDDTVRLTGTVNREITRKRIVATIGNIEGIENVDDNLTVEEITGDNVRYYEVKSGDTLSAIAKEMYGDASMYPQIFEANKPMLSDPDKIYPGQKLVIPAQS